MTEQTLPKKPRRHRLTKMVYDEISFVDRGANQHANVMIVKRDVSKDVSKMVPGDQNTSGGGGGKKSSGGRSAGWYASDRAPTQDGSGKGKKSERAQHWKAERHPRNAAGSGSPRGGTFKSTSSSSKKKYGKGGTTKAKQNAKKKTSSKTTATKTVSYKMKKGDTLWALAQKYYGDGTQWKKIAKASGIKDPRKIPVGAKITIPGVKTKATKKTKASSSASPGERLTMEAGGRVHWEKIKARKTSSTKSPKTKAEITAQRKAAAKAKADRVKRQREARKKLAIKKRVTEIEKVEAQIMFTQYLEGR